MYSTLVSRYMGIVPTHRALCRYSTLPIGPDTGMALFRL